MAHDTGDIPSMTRGGGHEHIEAFLHTRRTSVREAPEKDAETASVPKAGRPVVLGSVQVWMGVLVAVGGWWNPPSADVGDQAVDKRLEAEGWQPLAQVFERVSQVLAHGLPSAHQHTSASLAPFASAVVARDEMHLDPVRRHVPLLRHVKKGDVPFLPGPRHAQ